MCLWQSGQYLVILGAWRIWVQYRALKGVMQLAGDEVWLWYDARPKGLSLSWASPLAVIL